MSLSSNHQEQASKLCCVSPHPDLLEKLNRFRLRLKEDPTAEPDEAVRDLLEFLKTKPRRRHKPAPVIDESTIAQSTQTRAAGMQPQAVVRGTVNVVVILANFRNVTLPSNTATVMQDLFFSSGVLPFGSVKEYYNEVSNNTVSISGQVIGPYTLDRKQEDYAAGNFGKANWPSLNASDMAGDALNLARNDVRAVKGAANALVVVHAGPAAETTGNKNDIWSLKWGLPWGGTTINGVKFSEFLTVAGSARVGVCCHELGHLVFGWPDLYDTDYSSQGLGNWCLMAGGSWGNGGLQPVHPSAWLMVGQGWSTSYNVINNGNTWIGPREAYRLWTYGSNSSEYYLAEVRTRTGFDQSLPAPGLLVWHINENAPNNDDESRPKIKLMQADGLDQLSGNTKGSGDPGDVFPGSTSNRSFGFGTNPSSRKYDYTDSYVSIFNIAPPSASMTLSVTVKPHGWTPVYSMGSPGSGIGGYNLGSPDDMAFAFDYNSSGKPDHLVLYRPGEGTIWILKRTGDNWSPLMYEGSPGNGIAGYNLADRRDRIVAYDYNSSGKLDHLVCYRPGGQNCWILRNNRGVFSAVYSSANGIGGYDLWDDNDQCFAFDFNSSGKLDHLCFYRPGDGSFYILRNSGGNFVQAYASKSGLDDWDLKDFRDRAFAFDFDGSGKLDHICLYRAVSGGPGNWVVVKHTGSGFTRVTDRYASIGCDLKNPEDRACAIDFSGNGRLDHLCFYRPRLGAYFVLRHDGDNRFSYVVREGSVVFPPDRIGVGIGGFDLQGPDYMFPFDYNSTGRADHVVIYRKDGSGTIWILRRDGSP